MVFLDLFGELFSRFCCELSKEEIKLGFVNFGYGLGSKRLNCRELCGDGSMEGFLVFLKKT